MEPHLLLPFPLFAVRCGHLPHSPLYTELFQLTNDYLGLNTPADQSIGAYHSLSNKSCLGPGALCALVRLIIRPRFPN